MINKKISVIVASYNEERNILPLYERLKNTLDKISTKYEIIFVDDGSTDNSVQIFKQLIKKDKNVSVIKFSRNFGGAHIAFTAGMAHATGDCVINMDGDGEDPPEVIQGFIEKWQEGFDIVYGIKRKRQVNLFRKIAYKLFYKAFHSVAYIDIPLDAGEFALMDKKVVDIINKLPEKDRFIRGLRAWVGFKSTGLPYRRPARMHGQTSNSFLANIRWAIKAIFSFSYFPLVFISYLAFVVFLLSLAGIAFYLISYFFTENPAQGITTIIILILLIGSMQLLAISIIGAYIAKILQEVKARPTYIIGEILKQKKGGKIKNEALHL
jgi:polyisoprenyl-phosphate glycosyltransferase